MTKQENNSKIKELILKSQRRRAEIIFLLYMQGKVVVKELAEEYGVDKRTIQKDMQLLKTTEFLDSVIEGGKGIYTIKNEEKLTGLKEIENYYNLNLINSLFTSIIEDKEKQLDSDNPIVLKPHCKKIEKDFFMKILSKINHKFPFAFTYRTKEGESKEFEVHPYKLVLLDNFWYLAARDIYDGKIKFFRIDRMNRKLKASSEPKEDKEKRKQALELILQIESPWYDEESRQTVKLKVKGEAKEYLQNNLPPNADLEKETKDYLLINYTYYHPDEALNLIKKWLPDIIILNNNELKEKLKKMLMKYLEEI